MASATLGDTCTFVDGKEQPEQEGHNEQEEEELEPRVTQSQERHGIGREINSGRRGVDMVERRRRLVEDNIAPTHIFTIYPADMVVLARR